MTPAGHYTHLEIHSQPEAWEAALAAIAKQAGALTSFLHANRFDAIVLAGCGSTYYLALSAAAALQAMLSLPARGVPASEVWLNPQTAYLPTQRTLLIALSRSGETTETLRACEAFRAHGQGEALTLSCYPGRALTEAGTYNLVLPSGQEDSIAQTRAFSTLYLGTLAVGALWSGRTDVLDDLGRLPAVARSLLGRCSETTQALGRDGRLDRFYFLGSGARYGLAAELSLKMKEMSLSHSEPFHCLEFRHGPKSMVTPNTLIVGLLSETHRAREQAVLEDMQAMGAQVLTLGERDCAVSFDSGITEPARNLLYLPVGQRLAFERSLFNGLNPDRPHNLEAVVTLK
jgi:glucosamine--fructose-6-phosphate aminotransferase (isomerizing)